MHTKVQNVISPWFCAKCGEVFSTLYRSLSTQLRFGIVSPFYIHCSRCDFIEMRHTNIKPNKFISNFFSRILSFHLVGAENTELITNHQQILRSKWYSPLRKPFSWKHIISPVNFHSHTTFDSFHSEYKHYFSISSFGPV